MRSQTLRLGSSSLWLEEVPPAQNTHSWRIRRAQELIQRDLIQQPISLVQAPLQPPRVTGAPMSCSWASRRGIFLLGASTSKQVGVDLETFPPAQLVPTEDGPRIEPLESWTRHDGRKLCEIWTIKEAFLKALGLGLSADMAWVDLRREDDHLSRAWFRSQSALIRTIWVHEQCLALAEVTTQDSGSDPLLSASPEVPEAR
ncbi:MAG: 4'-phosphopantetheinyl transferase superfamily protein [Verrucomicrobiota bacterium]